MSEKCSGTFPSVYENGDFWVNLEVENQSVDVRIYRCIQLAGLTRASLSLLKYYGNVR